MCTIAEFVATVGWRIADDTAWEWAGNLDAEKRAIVEWALALYGIDGVGELVVAGPALGGLDGEDIDALARFAAGRLDPATLAA